MAPEGNRFLRRRCGEEVCEQTNTAEDVERDTARENETLARKIVGLVLALATEPAKLAQARQMLIQL